MSLTENENYVYTTIVLVVVSYLALVQALRFRNTAKIKTLAEKYADDFSKMDYKTAFQIFNLTLQYEFPFLFGFGTQWALVKSYGIAEGTQLLVDTRQLTKNTGKRAEDTGVFLAEIYVSGIDSERGSRAIAKMNWLHRRYKSRIPNHGFIFTLGLFVIEPQRWIDKYGWRPLLPAEKAAIFVYWKEIGNRMGIHDIPPTLEALEKWQEDFIARNMYFAESNRVLAEATMDLFLRPIPHIFRGWFRKIVTAFLEPHAREALGYEHPPNYVEVMVDLALRTCTLLNRHFFLPRPRPRLSIDQPGEDGRIHRGDYLFEPWYVAETAWIRLRKRFWKPSIPLPGPEYKSRGYLPEELGPSVYEKISREDVLKEANEILEYARKGGASGVGCPFHLG